VVSPPKRTRTTSDLGTPFLNLVSARRLLQRFGAGVGGFFFLFIFFFSCFTTLVSLQRVSCLPCWGVILIHALELGLSSVGPLAPSLHATTRRWRFLVVGSLGLISETGDARVFCDFLWGLDGSGSCPAAFE
jgi:hypothetical protein